MDTVYKESLWDGVDDVSKLPDMQSWMHLTFSAEWENVAMGGGNSYLRIDFPDLNRVITGSYTNMKTEEVYVGIGSDMKRGFNGDIREVWVSLGYLEHADVPKIMNMNKVFDVSTMGYYKFQSPIGRLSDAMRDQQA